MAFRTQDLPKTVRRDKRTGARRLYPRFLRDDAIKPQVGIAIRFFETKLGLLRRDLEPEMSSRDPFDFYSRWKDSEMRD